jgi:hypothetical protein
VGPDPGPTNALWVVRALRVDPDTILLVGGSMLSLVRRGAGPGEVLVRQLPQPASLEPGETAAVTTDAALARTSTRPDGLRDLLVVGAVFKSDTFGPKRGVVWRGRVGPSGFEGLRIVDLRSAAELRGVALADDGRALASGPDGLVLARSATSTVFVAEYPFPNARNREGGFARFTGDPAFPAIVAHAGQVARFEAATRRWEPDELVDSPLFSGDPITWHDVALELDPRAGGAGVWAVGERGVLAQRLPGEPRWSFLSPLDFPRAFARCAPVDREGNLRFFEPMVAVAVTPTHILLGAGGCPAVLAVSRRDRCVGLGFVGGQDQVGQLFEPAQLLVEGDTLTVVQVRGTIWTARLSP